VNEIPALVCRSFGPPPDLAIETVEAPRVGPGEALVQVEFVALNFFDTLIVQGKYQTRPQPPFSPGGEFSGRIVALGGGVESFTVGERVFGSMAYGAARGLVAAPATRLVAIPEGLSMERAAGLSVAYGTTLHAYLQRARLRPGETVVVLGASGGVGLAAVEIGALLGARVIACASSPEKVALALAHGAAEGVDCSTQDLREGLRGLEPLGVDVVYDPVGGAQTEIGLRALKDGGRLLVVGFASGEVSRPPLNIALVKGADLLGVEWGKFAARDPKANRDNLSRIAAWAGEGKLATHIHAIHQLPDFASAFADIAARRVQGKVLLRVWDV
jgi:NADPH2:quinone reductase